MQPEAVFEALAFADQGYNRGGPEYCKLAKAVIVADFPGKFGLIKECFTKVFP